MFLYLLERDEKSCDYDKMRACVVAAYDEASAREIALRASAPSEANVKYEEERAVWREVATCKLLGVAAEGIAEGMVLSDCETG